MANYTVKLPDGRTYRVKAPDGTTPDQVKAYIQAKIAGGAPPVPKTQPQNLATKIRAFASSVADGALPNLGENLYGAAGALDNLGSAAWNGAPLNMSKAFTDAANRSRSRSAQFKSDHPNIDNAGRWAGFAGSLVATPEIKVLRAAKPVAEIASKGAEALAARTAVPASVIAKAALARKAKVALVNNAATGGVYGGVAGTLQGEGSDRIKNGVTGLIAGTVLGAATPPVVGFGVEAAKRGGRVAAPYVAPAVAAGVVARNAQRGVGEALESKFTPAEASAEISARAPAVPAMVADLTDQSRQLLGHSSRGLGPGQSAVREAIASRQANSVSRVQANIADTLGPIADPYAQSSALVDKARADAKPFYDEAYNQPIVTTPELAEFRRSPQGGAAVDAGMADIINTPTIDRNVGSENPTIRGIGWDRAIKPDGAFRSADVPVMEAWDGAKRHLDNIVSDSENTFVPSTGPTTNTRPAKLQRTRLLEELDAQNPAYAKAREAYSGPAAENDAFIAGRQEAPGSVRKTVADATNQMAKMTDSQRAQFQLGDRSRLTDVVGTRPTFADATAPLLSNDVRASLIREIHGPEAADRLADLTAKERDAHLTYKEVFGNSMTANRAAVDDGMSEEALASAGKALSKGRFMSAAGSMIAGGWKGRIGRYGHDLKNELGQILTETKPENVSAAMAAIADRANKDQAFAARLRGAGAQAGKIGAIQIVGNSGDDTGMYPDRQ